MKQVLLFILPLFLFSCSGEPKKQVDEGVVTGETYESKEIGWSIVIPAGYNIVSKDKLVANDEAGREAIEKASGVVIDAKQLKHLISIQKDPFNVLAATSEPYKEEYEGEYMETNRQVMDLIYQTFVSQGIQADTASGTEMIQGLKFNTFYATIFSQEGDTIMNQVLYSTLRNGFDFGVNINYNNTADKKLLMDAWKNSRFISN
jgi:hypothetical protein